MALYIISQPMKQEPPSKHKTFVQRRPNVFDVDPTLYKCYTNVLRLLGIRPLYCHEKPKGIHCLLNFSLLLSET